MSKLPLIFIILTVVYLTQAFPQSPPDSVLVPSWGPTLFNPAIPEWCKYIPNRVRPYVPECRENYQNFPKLPRLTLPPTEAPETQQSETTEDNLGSDALEITVTSDDNTQEPNEGSNATEQQVPLQAQRDQ